MEEDSSTYGIQAGAFIVGDHHMIHFPPVEDLYNHYKSCRFRTSHAPCDLPYIEQLSGEDDHQANQD